MTIKIKSLKDLEGMLQNKIANDLFFSSNVQDRIAETMHEKIISNVYNVFTPTEYERRGNDDGFSDMNNMQFTSVDVSNGAVRFVFENTTEGNDSMSGQELTDMFETGKGKWDNPNVVDNQGRVNSAPRPFIDDTISELNQNKTQLQDALKKDLAKLGFKVK